MKSLSTFSTILAPYPRAQSVVCLSSGSSPYSSNRQRLSKVLANFGVASRRKAEELIFDGRVQVNGEIVTIPQTPVHHTRDEIVVDGTKMKKPRKDQKLYFVLNKPKGYLCTSKVETENNRKGKLVLDLFQEWLERWKKRNPQAVLPPRLFTVGRLDCNSWGLLFVTNDGEWAQQVAHPSSGLTKEYVVRVTPPVTMTEARTISEGCEIDGKFVQPLGVAIENDFLRIAVSEGRKREV